jgi:hypothetical protein
MGGDEFTVTDQCESGALEGRCGRRFAIRYACRRGPASWRPAVPSLRRTHQSPCGSLRRSAGRLISSLGISASFNSRASFRLRARLATRTDRGGDRPRIPSPAAEGNQRWPRCSIRPKRRRMAQPECRRALLHGAAPHPSQQRPRCCLPRAKATAMPETSSTAIIGAGCWCGATPQRRCPA